MDNTTYEFFIRRAWECERFQKGANTDTWDSLLYKKYNLDSSVGTPTESKNRAEFDIKFAEVKQHISNAYNNLLYRSTKITDNDELVNALLDLKTRASNAVNPNDLFLILRDSFQIINDNNL